MESMWHHFEDGNINMKYLNEPKVRKQCLKGDDNGGPHDPSK